MDTVGIIAAFICYLGTMIFIGWRYLKKNSSTSDFFLGGRNVGPWMTALSAEASDMSGWLLMGLPGVAYLVGGMNEAFWTAVGLIIGTYLNWLIVAKRLRKYTIHSNDSITIPEFFSNRFKDKSGIIALVSGIFILLFFTIYAASGFVACAKLFNSVFGIPYFWALLIGIAVILAYTLLGGYLAVCATDFIQGTIMLIALVVTAGVMVVSLNGRGEIFSLVTDFQNAAASTFADGSLNPVAGRSFDTISIISALAWGLGYFGMPHILVRFMGIRSNHEIRVSRRIALGWVIMAFAGALLVGVLGGAFLMPTVLPKGAAETVFIISIRQMFPAFIAGIFLCGMMAAAMSTADSQLLVSASAFSRDIFKGLLKRDASEKLTLTVSRITVIAVALVAFVIAMEPDSSIFSLVSYAWAGFGATFGPIVLLSMFWRGMTGKGALAGIVAGGIVVILWHGLSGGIFDLYEILPGFLACTLFALIVSLADKNKDPEMLKEFDAYQELAD